MVPIGMVRRRWCVSTTCGLVGGRGRLERPTELHTLLKMNANWQDIVKGAAYDREIKDRNRGQPELTLEGHDQ